MKNVHDGLSKKRKTGAGLVRDEVALEPDNVSKFCGVQAGATHKQSINVSSSHNGGGVVGLDGASVEQAGLGRDSVIKKHCEFCADGGAHFLRVLRARYLTGTDGPDRLISHDEIRGLFVSQSVNPRTQLRESVLNVGACLADFEAFAHAEDGSDLMAEGCLDLGVEDLVRFVVDGPSLAVTHQNIGTSQLVKELAGNVARVGSRVELRKILAAIDDVELVALDEGLDSAQIGEGGNTATSTRL